MRKMLEKVLGLFMEVKVETPNPAADLGLDARLQQKLSKSYEEHRRLNPDKYDVAALSIDELHDICHSAITLRDISFPEPDWMDADVGRWIDICRDRGFEPFAEQCRWCRFWKRPATTPNKGECRHRSPTSSMFPITTDMDYCGDFKRR